MNAESCPAYILAGGASSRFASDKAMIDVLGQKQLLRLRAGLVKLGHDVQIVADDEHKYTTLGVRCLVDSHANCGPIAGLAAALQHRLAAAGPGWLLLLGCDQVVWRDQWYQELAAAREAASQAIVFCSGDLTAPGFAQPIPGLYHTDLLACARRNIEQGKYALRQLANAGAATCVTTQENPCRWSFNTPRELEELLAKLPDASRPRVDWTG